LLDDIVLTHSLFLPTERFLQQLHQQYPGGPWGATRVGTRVGEEGPPARWEEGSGLRRKRAVLAVLLHFLETYKGLLQEEESAGKVIKELYLLIMKDTSLYHELEDEIIKLHQLVETVELKVADETPPPNKQGKPLLRHFRRIDSCLQTRVAFRGSDETLSCAPLPRRVADETPPPNKQVKPLFRHFRRIDSCLQTRVAFRGSDEKREGTQHPLSAPAGVPSQVPLPEEIQVVPGDTEIHRAEPEDYVANHLTAFHWELFRCIHELEFVDYVFHGERGRRETANLELLLQRCSEVQHWVGTELLLCEGLGKRAHLLKKLIKIAAICKQNQDMLSFYAIVIGLNNAAISRLRLTWEKLPGKFKNLFRKFENLTDPCRNHKTYREVLAKMKPPLIPFVPLILKDLTFLHEGSKTLLDGLVNVEKLHCIAEKVRTVRKYRSRPLCLELEASPTQLQTKAYVRQLRVIDNQNLLFELSYKLEPGSQ
ncbi:RPGFL factor, partial [Cnemophilus loriae]|nr:RPGFL factor [Cnemophilus loriae]